VSPWEEEIRAYRERAWQSLEAARQLASCGYPEFAVSRAYYAVFYLAKALLLQDGVEVNKHSAVIASFHQKFVKTGRLPMAEGQRLHWLFELRNLADYAVSVHLSEQQMNVNWKALPRCRKTGR